MTEGPRVNFVMREAENTGSVKVSTKTWSGLKLLVWSLILVWSLLVSTPDR